MKVQSLNIIFLCIFSSNCVSTVQTKTMSTISKAYRTLLVQNMAWILQWSWKTINWKKKINIIWALFSPLPIIVYMKECKKMEACQSNDQWSTSDHLILPLYWDIVVLIDSLSKTDHRNHTEYMTVSCNHIPYNSS